MTPLNHDLRYSLRMLIKSPGFTAVAVVTLALGIGVNTAIFSVVNAVILKPLPYPDSSRLVTIWVTEPSGPGNLYPDTGPDFVDWKAQNKVFDSMAAVTITGATLTGTSEPLQLQGFEVSPEIFPLLGATPFLGRNFSAEETQSGHDSVVILSFGLWQRAFGGEHNVLGNKITLDGQPYIVAGVMPRRIRVSPHLGQQTRVLDSDESSAVRVAKIARQSLDVGDWPMKNGIGIERAQGGHGDPFQPARPTVSPTPTPALRPRWSACRTN